MAAEQKLVFLKILARLCSSFWTKMRMGNIFAVSFTRISIFLKRHTKKTSMCVGLAGYVAIL